MEILRRAPMHPLQDAVVAILGYGNQGTAHALNMRDSGLHVIIGARPGSASARSAAEAGFEVSDLAGASARGDLVIVALPDEVQGAVYRDQIAPSLRPGATVGFLHGFAVRYGLVEPGPEQGVVLVAPKGPGTTLRARFAEGSGIPCLLAVHQETQAGDAEARALAWAAAIGCARAAIIRTTFADETETDLFGEQAVLCGGVTGLVLAAFTILVEAGYPPELAYVECCHELKQVVDLMHERGPAGMAKAISNTAEFGAYVAAGQIVDDHLRASMQRLLASIRGGDFARRMQQDHQGGFLWFEAQRQALRTHPIERAGEHVRALLRGEPGDDASAAPGRRGTGA